VFSVFAKKEKEKERIIFISFLKYVLGQVISIIYYLKVSTYDGYY